MNRISRLIGIFICIAITCLLFGCNSKQMYCSIEIVTEDFLKPKIFYSYIDSQYHFAGKSYSYDIAFSDEVYDSYDAVYTYESASGEIMAACEKGYGIFDGNGEMLTEQLWTWIYPLYDPESHWVYRNGIQFGLLTHNGKVVVPAQYDFITDYNEGLVRFGQNNYYGYMNLYGEILLPAQFSLPYHYFKNLEEDSREIYGLTWNPPEMREWLNNPAVKQDWIMSTAYSSLKDDCLRFQSGIALYGIPSKKHGIHNGIIDQRGNILHQFGSEVFSVKLCQNGFTITEQSSNYDAKKNYDEAEGIGITQREFVLWPFQSISLYNKKGEMVYTSPQTKLSYSSQNCGLFLVSTSKAEKGENEKYGYLSEDGSYRIPPIYDHLSDFKEEICISKKDEMYGYIRNDGTVLSEPIWKKAFPFSEGYACVVASNGQIAFLNSEGSIEISLEKNLYPAKGINREDNVKFSEGLAVVANENEKVGYIDLKGVYQLFPQWDSADPFVDGKAIVGEKKNGQILFGVIDKAETKILPIQYKLIRPLDRFYLVESCANLFGVFNGNGDEILPVQFEEIELSGSVFQVKYNGKSGLYTLDGVQVLPTEYEELERESSTGFRAIKKGVEYCIRIEV